MTDYGRGQGPAPWYPEDPLGDQWTDPYQQQQNQQQTYSQPQTYSNNGWDPYGGGQQHQQQPQYPYDGQQQYYPEQGRQQHQQQYDAWGNPVGYDNGQYGGQPQQYQQPQHGQPEQQPHHDPYAPQEEQPYQERPEERTAQQRIDWDADPEAPAADDHPFFSNGTAGEDDEDGYERAGKAKGGKSTGKAKGGKSKGGKKRRSGCACLVVVLVLGGGLAGAGLFGYRFYQDHFGPPPDYAGQGTGEVQVEIPDGSTLTDMGNILKKSGVVKSVDAFNDAARDNSNSIKIQGGVYVLHKEMSAASAITMMLDPKAQSVLIVAEGMRDSQVYEAIDHKLGVAAGTTRKVAFSQAKKLGLPSWADDNSNIKDPLEGFLYPSRYSVGKTTKPVDLLRQMVSRASAQYAQADLSAAVKKYGLKSPLQVITVASLVQAEGKTDEDFRKMARVVYNRLNPANPQTYGSLEFDSTYNYIKNQSKIDLSVSELRNYNNPYNTYYVKGLPPGPIGNPGKAALDAAMNPATGNWYYFVSVDGEKTQFTETLAEHDKLVQEFNERRKNDG